MILPFVADSAGYLHFDELGLSPIALDLGFFQIKWYSLGYIAGIVIGWWYLLKLLAQPGAPMARRHADDLVFYATLGIILGGRIGYVLFYRPEMLARPPEILQLWEGGMSFHGGLIGVVLALLYLARKNGLNWLRVHDYVACCVPPGLFLVRIANFVNGELWGRPTNAPWAVIFPRAGPEPRHPSQLYEAVGEGILLFIILWFLFWKTDARYQPGKLVGTFALGYGLIRVALERVRNPDAGLEHLAWGLTMGQTLSVPLILIGLYLIVTAKSRRERVEGIAGARKRRLMAEGATCADAIAAAITIQGSIPVAHFMAAANRHYYATRDPLGTEGDFTTAPEISQIFGELIGLWLADLWSRAGKPEAHYVELGPGRGTLATDARRAMRSAGFDPGIHFVETSPVLQAAQRDRHPDAVFHDSIDTLPTDAPLLIVANEFFDALPVRQLVHAANGWRERHVTWAKPLFVPVASGPRLDGILPEHLRTAAIGSIVETSPTSVAITRTLARRMVAQGGAALIVDYGHEGPAVGDTLQAVRAHAYANPFEEPGERDLTAHVDFATMAEAATADGAVARGPIEQGLWLERMGIKSRADRLSLGAPERSKEVAATVERLTNPNAMGKLFKALAITAPEWPEPAGFAG